MPLLWRSSRKDLMEKLLEDLKDLASSLRTPNIDNSLFREKWIVKNRRVREAVNALSKEDYDKLEEGYRGWCECQPWFKK